VFDLEKAKESSKLDSLKLKVAVLEEVFDLEHKTIRAWSLALVETDGCRADTSTGRKIYWEWRKCH